jgi:hypothetical protein
MPDFQQLKSTDNPWLPRNQDAFDLLESITAVDKALSQPYIKIWQVNPDGTPTHPDQNDQTKPDVSKTISTALMQPPQFGSSVDRYSERAPVALERVSVKRQFSPHGPIMYRTVTIDLVVFQPERVFDESNQDFSEFCALILPGSTFLLRYGWTGTSGNDLLNGNGLVDQNNIVEGQTDLLIAITTYNFTINPDGSLNLTIHAIENGDNVLNHVHLADIDYFSSQPSAGNESKSTYTSDPGTNVKQTATPNGQALIKRLQSDIHNLNWTKVGKSGLAVPLIDVLNKIFSPLMTKAIKSIGYDDVNLYVGMFNADIGVAKKDFGGSMTGKSIGDFMITESWMKDLLGDKRANGEQMNLLSFLENILRFVQTPENWTGTVLSPAESDQVKQNAKTPKDIPAEEMKILAKRKSPPTINIKTATNRKNGKLVFNLYIYDMRLMDANIDVSDRLNPKTTRDQIIQKLKKYAIPLVTFKHGLSYIQEASFTMEMDQQLQHIALERALDPNRYQTVGVTHAARAASAIDPRTLILGSLITGKVSMIGNFAWDTFHRIWLEFGVRRWDGPFFMMDREDVIDASNFTTNFNVRAVGDDPLNTRGVLQDDQHRTTT